MKIIDNRVLGFKYIQSRRNRITTDRKGRTIQEKVWGKCCNKASRCSAKILYHMNGDIIELDGIKIANLEHEAVRELIVSQHNHEPDSEIQEMILESLNLLKKDCQTNVSILKSYEFRKAKFVKEYVMLQEDKAAAYVFAIRKYPQFLSIESTLNRARSRRFPSIPQFNDLVIPDEWKTIKESDERILLLHHREAQSQIIILATDDGIRRLATDRWQMDGTFKSATNWFHQHYIRRRAFEIGVVLDPKVVMSDYELAIHSPIKHFWPNIEMKGCFFHFAQCLFKNLCQKGFKVAYSKTFKGHTNNLKIFLKRIIGLALLPPAFVTEYWAMIKLDVLRNGKVFDCNDTLCVCENEDIPSLESYISYFENTWLQRFDILIWNHFTNRGPRTNNHSEGYHNRIGHIWGCTHPNIWRFLDHVMSEELVAQSKHTLLIQDELKLRNLSSRVRERDSRIEKSIDEYQMTLLSTSEYFNQICSTININFSVQVPIVSVAPLHIVENDSAYNSEDSNDTIPQPSSDEIISMDELMSDDEESDDEFDVIDNEIIRLFEQSAVTTNVNIDLITMEPVNQEITQDIDMPNTQDITQDTDKPNKRRCSECNKQISINTNGTLRKHKCV
jgi:hypothetical protein